MVDDHRSPAETMAVYRKPTLRLLSDVVTCPTCGQDVRVSNGVVGSVGYLIRHLTDGSWCPEPTARG